MPYPRRTGSRCSASGDKKQNETCQAQGEWTQQGQMLPGGGCRKDGAKSRFSTEVSHGWGPSAHGGSDSQGAPCVRCSHAAADEMSHRRDDRRGGSPEDGREENVPSEQILWMLSFWTWSSPLYSGTPVTPTIIFSLVGQ